MAIIVEDGSIVSGANSYISEAYLESYASDRGITISGESDELIIQSTDYLETLMYKGTRVNVDQELKWPRFGVVVDGVPIEYNEIPTILKKAQAEVCLAIDAGNGPMADLPRQTVREKVDVLEVEYSAGSNSLPTNRKILSILSPLLSGGSGWQFTVDKG